MENQWAEPTGYASKPNPIRYKIRKATSTFKQGEKYFGYTIYPVEVSDEVVEHKTTVAFDRMPTQRWFHALATEDQWIADLITRIIQTAASYFYADEWVPMEGVQDIIISDDEVRERVYRLNKGENWREAMRVSRNFYDLQDLPFDQQRAMVEQIEALKREYCFEIIGEVEDERTSSPSSG